MKMRGSKRNMLLAGILLLAMAGIGHGYASWNREQSISMELATGKFKHFFSQKGIAPRRSWMRREMSFSR